MNRPDPVGQHTEPDLITRSAVEEWSSHGLLCAICRTPVGAAGYVQTTPEVRNAMTRHFGEDLLGVHIADGVQPITYRPDAHGWIGIDLGLFATPTRLRPSVNALAAALTALPYESPEAAR